MRENLVRKRWAAGEPALGAWLTIPSSFSAETIAHAGFDWVCIDMQHGVIEYAQAVLMLQGFSSTDVTPLIRVPWNEPGIIGKSLDAGARGIIIPMVNSPEEARAAVAACRYAPLGKRSYGPLRANTHYGPDYFANANTDIICLVMIETRQAVEQVDAILSTPGVDAVYVGPADLSLTLGLSPAADHPEAIFKDALTRIVDSCRRHNVVPGTAGNAAVAPKRIEQGFRLVEVANDSRLLSAGAEQALRQVRPSAAPEKKSAYL